VLTWDEAITHGYSLAQSSGSLHPSSLEHVDRLRSFLHLESRGVCRLSWGYRQSFPRGPSGSCGKIVNGVNREPGCLGASKEGWGPGSCAWMKTEHPKSPTILPRPV
jgi:hypothetical protein